ncbi:MAG TPA: glycosyltransferase [Pirellulales bacterium]|nr:glycosyltransferase [Pirellulales bacterium]
MNNLADLSVIIPTYNHARYLPRALEALVTQSVLPAEIIVVNDASTDETPAILEAFARDYAVVKVITNPVNRRANQSVRIGLSNARGKYVYCVASDDYVLPGFVEKMVGAMEAFPQAGLCSAYFSIVNGVTGEIRPNPSGWCTEPRYFAPEEFEKRIGQGSIPGHASIIKRSSFQAAGGFLAELEWHSDWFVSLVVAFREGICHVPETLSLLTDMPQTYSADGMRSEKQLGVLNAVLNRLTSADYADVLPSFQRSGAMGAFGLPLLRSAARRPDLWTKSILPLLNSFRTEDYEALLEDSDSRVRELAAFFLGPFWPETKERRARELEERRELERAVAEQRPTKELREELSAREQELHQSRQELADKEQRLLVAEQMLAKRSAQLLQCEGWEMELRQIVQRMESSYFWKLRTLLRDCKNATVGSLRKAA